MNQERDDVPFGLRIRSLRAGKDVLILLTGGVEHIGATATCRLEGLVPVTETLQLPHHREGELAAELAQEAAVALGATVMVAAGIHIEAATKEDIASILFHARKLFRSELQALRSDPGYEWPTR